MVIDNGSLVAMLYGLADRIGRLELDPTTKKNALERAQSLCDRYRSLEFDANLVDTWLLQVSKERKVAK